MFNKPNLFPKASDPAQARSNARPGAGSKGGDSPTGFHANPTASQPAAAAFAASQPSRAGEAAREGESRLIVGPDVKLRGAEILDCDTLVVEGRVEATMDSRLLRIAEGGAFSGKVAVDVAEIYGDFEGELSTEQLIIHATGKVNGSIRYGKIFIEEGGQICGDINAGPRAEAAAQAFSRNTNNDKKQQGSQETGGAQPLTA